MKSFCSVYASERHMAILSVLALKDAMGSKNLRLGKPPSLSILLFLLLHTASAAGPASSTPLGDLASQMQPGTWASLSTNNLAALTVSDYAHTGNALPYAMTGEWDSQA